MSDHRPTGTGWPDDAVSRPAPPALSTKPAPPALSTEPAPPSARRGLTSAGVIIAVLLGLLGFTLVVQVKNNSTETGLASARQEDLVRILSDLEARDQRLRQEISGLEDSQRQLTSGVEGRQAALEEARRRADELGLLAGTLPARGSGLSVKFSAGNEPIRAAALLDAVQELRGAGAEAMQVRGASGDPVRIIASTYFLDADGGITVDGRRLAGPYTIDVIGDPRTMETALKIPGGVVESVGNDNGTVIVQERDEVEVSALSAPATPQYARPAS
ncbi:DUF881 domain-containing protein [Actinomycetes bacterium KLBMP 9797]